MIRTGVTATEPGRLVRARGHAHLSGVDVTLVGVMKLPRVECPVCGRNVAVLPLPGQAVRGRVWRHDAPEVRRDADGALVSCRGALEIVDITAVAAQLAFEVDALERDDDAPTLFVI